SIGADLTESYSVYGGIELTSTSVRFLKLKLSA
ncbi:unnamed protein product, partial [marine sediment metagenome]